MTHRRRNFLLRGLGVALTLAVIALDAADALAPVERWWYDTRAGLFQRFTPAPASQLVHVDIDDGALEAVGAWPWPRSTLADIVDEFRLAGAQIVALDVLFSEGQPEHDERFAESIKRAGNVLVPASFTFERPAAPAADHVAVMELLRGDVELAWEDVSGRLSDRFPALTEQTFLAARTEAVAWRAGREWTGGCGGVDELKRRLLPRAFAVGGGAGGSLARVVEATWRRLEVENSLSRFARPAPPNLDAPAANAGGLQPLVPELAAASAFGGYVDLLRPEEDGGTVRSIPLWIEHRGRLHPQMALSLACSIIGTDPSAITFVDGGMRLPRPGRGDLFVPLRAARSEKLGRVGMFFDIPWVGGPDWQTMYDWPAHRAVAQHVPITLAWAVADGRRKVVANNVLADEAMRFIVERFGYAETAKPFLARPTPLDECTERGRAIREAVAELEPLMGAYDGTKPQELTPEERELINAYDVLRTAGAQNAEINRTLPRKAAELRDALAGKAVLVGWVATAATDNYPTPLHHLCPGVVVHGSIVNALVNGDVLRRAPGWVTALVTLAIGLLTTLIVGWLDPWRALVLSGLLVFAYLGLNGVTLFDYGNWIVGAAGPAAAGVAVWSGLTLTRFVGEAKEKGRITRRFGSYADPNLVRFIVDHPELSSTAGRVEELTVVFTDLAGFTTLTERLREKAVPILSDYMSRMVPVIQERRGLVNKFLGDGIMFFYGAPVPNPDHAADAVDTVMAMAGVLEQFNRELAAAGNPTVSMRAGVSTGPMVVGDAGSALRSDYTVLGDAVNLGARLESANKAVGTKVMLSGRTVELLGGRFLVRPIGKLRVAGKTNGVATFEPLARADEATEEQKALAAATTGMVEAYQASRFADCIAACDRMDATFRASTLTHLYRELCTEFLTTRPDNFDGVVALKDK